MIIRNINNYYYEELRLRYFDSLMDNFNMKKAISHV